MIRIFFKTIWNNRMRNVLVFIELFIISLVLINLSVYLTERIRIRSIKTCYDMTDVLGLSIYNKEDPNGDDISFDENKLELFHNLKLKLESNELVERVSFPSNASPFYRSSSGCSYDFGDEEVFINRMYVDYDYMEVMKIQPLKGRWFNESDRGKAVLPALISKSIEEKYFNGDAVGKMLGGREYCHLEIIGVVEEFKRTGFEEPRPMAFVFNEDLSNERRMEILIRTKPGEAENFLKITEREVLSVLDPNIWIIRTLNTFDNMKSTANLQQLQRKYLGVLLAIFVMINVLLGVIGVLWYNTNLRIHEVGVRRAMGATANSIKRQLIFENLVIGGLGLMVVVLVYLQVPSIRLTDVEPQVMNLSIMISVITMVLLILLSTWIPSSIASKIRPAEALKTE